MQDFWKAPGIVIGIWDSFGFESQVFIYITTHKTSVVSGWNESLIIEQVHIQKNFSPHQKTEIITTKKKH